VFRKEERRLAHEVVSLQASSVNEDSVRLVGLDHVIPGGKYDKQSTN